MLGFYSKRKVFRTLAEAEFLGEQNAGASPLQHAMRSRVHRTYYAGLFSFLLAVPGFLWSSDVWYDAV